MFDLQPGVHLHEPEPVRAQRARAVNDELDGSCTLIADRCAASTAALPIAARTSAGMPGAGASSITFWWRRCRLQSRSNRCTTLPCVVAKDLNFDVARVGDVFLDQTGRIAKAAAASRWAVSSACRKVAGVDDKSHALAAAASPRLDQHRIADRGGLGGQKDRVLFAHDSRAPPARRPFPSASWRHPSAPWRGWRWRGGQ